MLQISFIMHERNFITHMHHSDSYNLLFCIKGNNVHLKFLIRCLKPIHQFSLMQLYSVIWLVDSSIHDRTWNCREITRVYERFREILTSIHSIEPISPYSSAPQLQNMMLRRGLHVPTGETWCFIIYHRKNEVNSIRAHDLFLYYFNMVHVVCTCEISWQSFKITKLSLKIKVL